MKTTTRFDLWLCVDCMFYAVDGGFAEIYKSLDTAEADARAAVVRASVDALGKHLVPDFVNNRDEDFSHDGYQDFTSETKCSACGTVHPGERYRFAIRAR